VVIQNCAAMPEKLMESMESILFGIVRGAYSGAENKKGLFEVADGGIIFLDELNSMPFHVQAKLLRVLQDGSFKPLGSNEDKKISTKITTKRLVNFLRI
jgi:arginine utilization regulatory protein